jgi:hypothetical protein
MTESELKDLKRQNNLCFIDRIRDRTLISISNISTEVQHLEEEANTLSSLEKFLQRYKEVLEGSVEALEDEPWLPLMEMLLSLLKPFSHISNEEIREAAEGEATNAFLILVEEMGFKEPSIRKTDVR